jgi:hypothetical protein
MRVLAYFRAGLNRFRSIKNRILARYWYARFQDRGHRRRIRKLLALSAAERADRGITRVVRMASTIPGLWSRTLGLTPQGSCQWGKTLFVADGEGDLCLVINSIVHPSNSPYRPQVTLPAPERLWGLHMEPEEYIRKLGYDDPIEHQQFSRFYTSAAYLLATNRIYRPAPPYVHLHLGKTWDFLVRQNNPRRKRFPLGLIMSNLQNIEGHRTRFAFLEALERSALPYVFWGRGEGFERFRSYRGFAFSKWKVHGSCRYSIVLENSVAPYYWSEKVADALLAWSLPIYHGCPNLDNYVPNESFIPIDIREPEAAIRTIEQVLRDDPYEARLRALAEARRRLLYEHHLYAFIDRELETYHA